MIRRLILAAALMLAVSSCAPQPVTQAEAGPVAPPGTTLVDVPGSPPGQSTPASRPQTAEACSAAGGKMIPVCRRQIAACVIAFSDAGKPCRDGADCQGNCIAPTEQAQGGSGNPAVGICAADDNPCGCKTTIEDGVAQATLCVD